MYVLFLDIDGVVNIETGINATYKHSNGHMENHLIDILNHFLGLVDIKIVISSSWREDMNDLKTQLEKHGFKYWHLVIDKIGEKDRGESIYEWLNNTEYNIDRYVIIDDYIDEIKKCKHIDISKIVMTDNAIGITHENVDDMLKICNF